MGSSASYLTAAVALLAVAIAAGQWHTARTKLVLDLFEKRLELATELHATLGKVFRDGAANTDDVIAFGHLEARAAYLFGTEVTKYLDSVRMDLAKLGVAKATSLGEFREDVHPMIREGELAFDRLTKFPVIFNKLTLPYMHMDAKLPRWRLFNL